MVKIELTEEMLERNISVAEHLVAIMDSRIEETHSGVARFLLESIRLETTELLVELRKFAPAKELVPHFAPELQPEG